MEQAVRAEGMDLREAPGTEQAAVRSAAPGKKTVYHIVKRLLDITVSLAALLLLCPFFLCIAVWIYADDPGPVLFFQERIGLRGKPFRMIKFRSMVTDAEERLKQLSGEEQEEFSRNFKLKEDPRLTRAGRIIRKTSIDEFPQFWNVLKGDMSLVGPRPPLPEERDAYGEHLERVMSVRPGITGYWQIHGRSDTDFAERIRMNEYYIDNCSLVLDLKILFGTIGAVLSERGAV